MLPRGVNLVDGLRESAEFDPEEARRLRALEKLVTHFKIADEEVEVVWRYILMSQNGGVALPMPNLDRMVKYYREVLDEPDGTSASSSV